MAAGQGSRALAGVIRHRRHGTGQDPQPAAGMAEPQPGGGSNEPPRWGEASWGIPEHGAGPASPVIAGCESGGRRCSAPRRGVGTRSTDAEQAGEAGAKCICSYKADFWKGLDLFPIPPGIRESVWPFRTAQTEAGLNPLPPAPSTPKTCPTSPPFCSPPPFPPFFSRFPDKDQTLPRGHPLQTQNNGADCERLSPAPHRRGINPPGELIPPAAEPARLSYILRAA